MKRLPRVATIATTTLTAVALTASMSACSSDSSNDAEEQNTDQQVTAEASTGADSDNENSDNTDADAASSEPTVPDGYTLTEVPEADLSFAIPSGWNTITGTDAASQTEMVDAIAAVLGRSSEEVLTSMESLALWSVDTSGTNDFTENLNVELLEEKYAVPTEDDMAQLLANQVNGSADMSMTPDSYTQTTTASGDDAVVQSYTLQIGGNTTKGAYVVVPAKGGDAFALIAVSTATAERTQELADVILGSI